MLSDLDFHIACVEISFQQENDKINAKRFIEFIAGPNLLITVNIQLVFPTPLRNTLEADELSICSL